MRWYSALMCTVPILMSALGPNLNLFNSDDLIENLKSQTTLSSLHGEFRSIEQAQETIIIPEQDNLSPEDDANQKFSLNSPEFFVKLQSNDNTDSHLAWEPQP